MEVRLNCHTDCEIVHKKLKNGAELYIIPKNRKTKVAVVSFRVGAADTQFSFKETKYTVPSGTAHFLEHRMFELKEECVIDRFSELGAYVNAYTDGSKTVYIFKATELFEESFRLLLDFVNKPYFVAEEINNEKKIIASEINMYGDDPFWQSYFGALKKLFPDSPISDEIAGSVKSIDQITPDILYLCHKAFYTPQNMTIVCGGGVNADEVIKIAEEMAVNGEEKAKKCRQHVKAVGGVSKIKMDISVPVYCIAFPARVDGGRIKNGFIYKILGDMLFGESSAAFKQIIKEDLSEDRPIVQYSSDGGVGIFAVTGTSTKCERTAEIIKKTLHDFAFKGEIDSKEFSACVRRVTGEIIRSLDDAEAAVNAQAEWSSENITAPEVITMVRNLTEREVFWAAKEIGKIYGLGIVSKE
ncbi:hypothetical protein SDC9_72954 [bioreactor metagenome]|uniref:Zinc protease AlbF n=1 Tax=bioreactor metagenome TaxID=1076179 RepID=A0A644YCT2_9ZZZZ|nr:pitrilysin family protein [Candidatus Metalachnospira sp.]